MKGNPLFCPECGGPAIPDFATMTGTCPKCHKVDPHAIPTYYHEYTVHDLMIALALKLGSQKAAARELGVSPSYFSDVVNRKRDVSDALARRLGLRRVVRYVIADAPDADEKAVEA